MRPDMTKWWYSTCSHFQTHQRINTSWKMVIILAEKCSNCLFRVSAKSENSDKFWFMGTKIDISDSLDFLFERRKKSWSLKSWKFLISFPLKMLKNFFGYCCRNNSSISTFKNQNFLTFLMKNQDLIRIIEIGLGVGKYPVYTTWKFSQCDFWATLYFIEHAKWALKFIA